MKFILEWEMEREIGRGGNSIKKSGGLYPLFRFLLFQQKMKRSLPSLCFFFSPRSFLDHLPSVSRFIFSDQNTGRSWGGEE
jgi:hypothetical protein